jgi:hypothetical protein
MPCIPREMIAAKIHRSCACVALAEENVVIGQQDFGQKNNLINS